MGDLGKLPFLLIFYCSCYFDCTAEMAEPPFTLVEDIRHNAEAFRVEIATPEQLTAFAEKLVLIMNSQLINDQRPVESFSEQSRRRVGAEPALLLVDWIKHLFRQILWFQLPSRIAFYGVIYLKRLHDRSMSIGKYNIYRLFMIAYKTFDDESLKLLVNRFFVLHIIDPYGALYPLDKVSEMEKEFLEILQWKTEIRATEMDWFLGLYFPGRGTEYGTPASSI